MSQILTYGFILTECEKKWIHSIFNLTLTKEIDDIYYFFTLFLMNYNTSDNMLQYSRSVFSHYELFVQTCMHDFTCILGFLGSLA